MTTFAPYPVAFEARRRHLASLSVPFYLTLTLLHAPLAIAMRQSDILATVHAVATLLTCMAIAIFSTRPVFVIAAMGYIAGAEVLWRMSKANIFWEFGKYCICLLLILGIYRLKSLRLPKLALLYFALLVPSCVTAYFGFGAGGAIEQVSFNLSGPLTVFLTLGFFRNAELGRSDIAAALGALVPPTVGIAAVAARSYGSAIRFTTASNAALSGGFGPNQVASALALGSLAAVWIIVTARLTGLRRLALLATSLGLYVQSAMTFSRGGVFMTGISLFIASLILMQDPRYRHMIVGSLLVSLFACAALFSSANAYTSGYLRARFERKDITNRDVLMVQDLAVWKAKPLFGAGVGYSSLAHLNRVASHTEYTRLVAEHGMLGALALASLLLVLYGRWRRCAEPLEKAFVACMFAWFLLYIGVNAMRLSAPVFVLALGYAQWKLVRRDAADSGKQGYSSLRRQ